MRSTFLIIVVLGLTSLCACNDSSPPQIVSVSPSSGPPAGGTAVTLSGDGFDDTNATVLFGGSPCLDIVVHSSTRITCKTPPHDAGPVDVTVTDFHLQTTTRVNGYTYAVANPTPTPTPVPPTPTPTATPTPTTPGPTALNYSTNPATYTKGIEILNNKPSSSGGPVQYYTVLPPLPGGLHLDSASGWITGTPTVAAAAADYTVSAVNAGGMAQVTLHLTVTERPLTGVTYLTNPATYSAGAEILNNTPTTQGSFAYASSYSVSPPLPSGLMLSPTTGWITGTPTAKTPTAGYLVTASNTVSAVQVSVQITVIAPPVNLSYSADPAVYTKGDTIPNNVPSLGAGASTNYSVFPALPAGLSLDPISGIISGTPTAITPSSGYKVTASNEDGNAQHGVTIAVNDVPPSSLTYATNPASYPIGNAITPNTPSNGGGAVTQYSFVPVLPAGLTLNTKTGVISGTPSALSSATPYLITAFNSGGFTQVSLSIAVPDAPPSNLQYAMNPAAYLKGFAIVPNQPSHSGGAVTSYSVSPALPTGISLDASTGIVSGTPTAVSTAAPYTVTAYNGLGSTQVSLSLAVTATPPADSWVATSTSGAPQAREYAAVVWTGSRMIVWGGLKIDGTNGVYVNDGGSYDPATDSWAPISSSGAPSAREALAVLWIGTKMLIWGGEVNGNPLASGGLYDPVGDSWTAVSTVGAPVYPFGCGPKMVWTGSKVLAWASGTCSNTGTYDPDTDTWTGLNTAGSPGSRSGGSLVWTGTRMLLWGGIPGSYTGSGSGGSALNSGGAYDPDTDSWTSLSTTGAPSARYAHAAIWTGTKMVIWGGSTQTYNSAFGWYNDFPLGNGGLYDPGTDSWLPMSNTNAPSARYNPVAVWTGTKMVVWGGRNNSIPLTDGGRYDLGSDSWTAVSSTNAPSTALESAIWTGSAMILWGGPNPAPADVPGTGALYGP